MKTAFHYNYSPEDAVSTHTDMDRRRFLATAGIAAAGAALAPSASGAARDWSGLNPVRYPDPDVVVLDKRFAGYKVGNAPIQRL